MRIYRLQVRVIQLSVLLAVIVMILGVFDVWQEKPARPAGGNTAGLNNPSSNHPAAGNLSAARVLLTQGASSLSTAKLFALAIHIHTVIPARKKIPGRR